MINICEIVRQTRCTSLIDIIIINEEMKYTHSSLVDLLAGENTIITTTLTEFKEPYNIFLLDENGYDITYTGTAPQLTLVSGFWTITIYSTDLVENVKIKLLY